MRISELSAASGVPIATLKFYRREGLLPAGDPRAVHRAEYGPTHLHRLRLIRALTEVGGLHLREVRAVLSALDDPELPLHDLLGVAQYALAPSAELEQADDRAGEALLAAGAADVDRLLQVLGWHVDDSAPARRTLARAVLSLRRLGWTASVEDLVPYGRVVDGLAVAEVASIPDRGDRAETVEHLVVGTVLFEAVLAALRHLAQEHHSAERFGRRG
jgi:DNA-binding transcriptional MerR regulator